MKLKKLAATIALLLLSNCGGHKKTSLGDLSNDKENPVKQEPDEKPVPDDRDQPKLVSEETSEAIGRHNGGCIRADFDLNHFEGNFVLERAWMKRHFAHGRSINYLKLISHQLEKKDIGPLQISDISRHGGGKLGGHKSHQMGLDLDIWNVWGDDPYRSFVYGNKVREKLYNKYRLGEVLEVAAKDKRVDRIFVNLAIKKHLCKSQEPELWMGKVRPWVGHTGHMHVRLTCAPDDQNCVNPGKLPNNSGCAYALSLPDDPFFIADDSFALEGLEKEKLAVPTRCR